MNGRRVVFLDKDGTVIDNVPYNVEPQKIRLAKGAGLGLRMLHQAGFELIVVTNQSGVALGRFEEDALQVVEQRLRELFEAERVPLSGFYYCPHHPDGSRREYALHCNCRKPKSGLLVQAADVDPIDFSQSWLIGDTLDDIEAGSRLGCRTILIDNGGETLWHDSPLRRPTATTVSLADAAATILTEDDDLPWPSPEQELTR